MNLVELGAWSQTITKDLTSESTFYFERTLSAMNFQLPAQQKNGLGLITSL